MSLRRTNVADVIDRKTKLANVFKQNMLFAGAVGTTRDVDVPVSAVERLSYATLRTNSMATSNSKTDDEWREDIKYILKTYSKVPVGALVEVMKKNGEELETIDVSISIDQRSKKMSILKNFIPVQEYSISQSKELIEFLEKHIKEDMKLRLTEIVFRATQA